MIKRKVFDMHAHIYPAKIVEKAVESICKFYEMPMRSVGSTENLLQQAKENNVERILVHSTATKPEQVESINNYIAEEIKKYGKFIGFGTLHPDYKDKEAEIDRMLSMGLRGVKLHPDFQHFSLDAECAQGIYKACSGRMPLLIHIGDYRYNESHPSRLMKVVERYPNLKMIAAHFGGWSIWQEGYENLEPSPNLYFDTSNSLYGIEKGVKKEMEKGMNKDLVYKMIDKHGSDKFLFGSDYPMWTQAEEIRRVEALELSEEIKEEIFHKNAERFLGLEETV